MCARPSANGQMDFGATVYTYGECNIGTRFLCTCAQCAHEKANRKPGTLFLYSKSIGDFNVETGFFSIRLAESHWFGLIETAQPIIIACPRKSPLARVFTTACPRKSPQARYRLRAS